MAKNRTTAKLFRNGQSQAVRLPQEFRFEGKQVRVRRMQGGVLLEPLIEDPSKWFAEMDRLNAGTFFEKGFVKGRKQPKAPKRRIFQ